jgi:hypothetical protein
VDVEALFNFEAFHLEITHGRVILESADLFNAIDLTPTSEYEAPVIAAALRNTARFIEKMYVRPKEASVAEHREG